MIESASHAALLIDSQPDGALIITAAGIAPLARLADAASTFEIVRGGIWGAGAGVACGGGGGGGGVFDRVRVYLNRRTRHR